MGSSAAQPPDLARGEAAPRIKEVQLPEQPLHAPRSSRRALESIVLQSYHYGRLAGIEVTNAADSVLPPGLLRGLRSYLS